MATYAGRYDEVLLRRAGNRIAPAAANTTVLVYESDGSTEATLYTDRTKSTAADNPVTVDDSGNVEFFVDPGIYVLAIREDGVQVATDTVTVFNDPSESTGGGDVSSVNGQTGAVVLDADDIDDTSTTNKFATAAELSKLAGIEANATADMTAAEVVATFTGTPDGTQFLRDDGTLATPAGGGGGATNLAWDAASSTVTSDSGTDAALTVVDGANPGLMSVAQKTKLDGIEAGATADQTGAEILTAIAGDVSDQTHTVAPRRIFETAAGTWTADAPAGRGNYEDTIEFIGPDDPTDVTNGITTPANIVAGDRWTETASYV